MAMAMRQEWSQRLRAAFRMHNERDLGDADQADDSSLASGSCVNQLMENVTAAAIAVHDADGRIHVSTADEDAIDVKSLQPRSMREATATPQDVAAYAPESIAHIPQMNVCIMIVGTRGDVQPFIGIAKRLQQDGHRVRLATHAVYRDFVTEHGVEFYPLGGDPKELAAYMVKTGGHIIPLKVETLTQDMPRNIQQIEEILNSTWPAVSAADPDALGPGKPGKPFQAHAIISNPVTYGHIHVAERLGVPLHIMFPQPWVPTVAFPHPLSNLPYNDQPLKRNYLSYKMVDLLMWQGTESMVNRFRTQVLGLRKIRKGDGGRDILLDLAIPHAFMWSPALVPKPADWGDIYDVIGTVLLKEAGSKYTPTPELEAFLGTDGGPIFVGFGSMVLADPLATTKMIIEAAQRANNVRVLIQSSWSDMSGDLDVPSNIFFLGNCPHDWLMPRVSAVVHHGGAGTTAAGLLAGKPTFIVPFFGDQPFWGRAVVKAGVGVEPCPIGELSVDRLTDAFLKLQDPGMRSRALAIRDVMAREDGVEEAVRVFYRHLPLAHMVCDLDHVNICSRWIVEHSIKVCEKCYSVIAKDPHNADKKVVPYRCVDYSHRGPSSGFSGAAAGAGAFIHEVGGAVKDVIVKPARGFRQDGPKGAVIGIVQGISGLVIRPVHGVALFADHIATGHANYFRPEGTKKRGSIIDDQLMAAIGQSDVIQASYSPGMSADQIEGVRIADVSQSQRRRVSVRLTEMERQKYQSRLSEILELRRCHPSPDSVLIGACETSASSTSPGSIHESSSIPPVSARSARIDVDGCVEVHFRNVDDNLNRVDTSKIIASPRMATTKENGSQRGVGTTPTLSICLATIGSWDHHVKQYVAIGVRLARDGHRVRVAAHPRHRAAIVKRGLEFYPLGGAADNLHDYMKYLRERSFIQRVLERTPLQDLREMIFSLWHAAISPDPDGTALGVPGRPFRADCMVCHPMVFGHVHVAERLGIPLQCVSLLPLSPTYSFPHILSRHLDEEREDGTFDALAGDFLETNRVSHSVVEAMIWHGLKDIIADFRSHIGLPSAGSSFNWLSEWDIPHIYLWEPSVLCKPLDWGSEISVVGYVSLEDDFERDQWAQFKFPKSFHDFVLGTRNPIVYFGMSVAGITPVQVRDIKRTVDEAARRSGVQIILQIAEDRHDLQDYHSDNVYEVSPSAPFAVLLRKVSGVVHWGSPSMQWEAIRAGKPTASWIRFPGFFFLAKLLANQKLALPPFNLAACTADNLTTLLARLLDSSLQKRVLEFASVINYDQAIEQAVDAFYSQLPVPAMVCDLDEHKLAHVYDRELELKLSYEAYAAVRALSGRNENNVLNYQPLRYTEGQPPKYTLRGIRGQAHRESIRQSTTTFEALTSLFLSSDDIDHPPQRLQLRSRCHSLLPEIEEQTSYWDSEWEEEQDSARILARFHQLTHSKERSQSLP
ncbi:hypothetical protein PINS_up005948 [Pythium insidiosum]|nr:hypothetical protein PINS_up005948 [Pythium insidiosum]